MGGPAGRGRRPGEERRPLQGPEDARTLDRQFAPEAGELDLVDREDRAVRARLLIGCSRSYDALGRLSQAQDDDSTVQYTYDSLSRVVTEVQGGNPLGSTGKTATYTANAEGETTRVAHPSGFEARCTLDALGRLTALEVQNDAAVASFDLCGAPFGRRGPASVTRPPQTTVRRNRRIVPGTVSR